MTFPENNYVNPQKRLIRDLPDFSEKNGMKNYDRKMKLLDYFKK